jgi:hypothetical protein
MEATVQTLRQQISVISNKDEVRAAINGELMLGQKKVLCVKGGNTASMIGQIYSEFARHQDSAGNPFYFSRRLRGLVHTDPIWNSVRKVDGSALADYLLKWFIPVEKVTNNDGDCLVIVDKLSTFFPALVLQSRNITNSIRDLLDWID